MLGCGIMKTKQKSRGMREGAMPKGKQIANGSGSEEEEIKLLN